MKYTRNKTQMPATSIKMKIAGFSYTRICAVDLNRTADIWRWNDAQTFNHGVCISRHVIALSTDRSIQKTSSYCGRPVHGNRQQDARRHCVCMSLGSYRCRRPSSTLAKSVACNRILTTYRTHPPRCGAPSVDVRRAASAASSAFFIIYRQRALPSAGSSDDRPFFPGSVDVTIGVLCEWRTHTPWPRRPVVNELFTPDHRLQSPNHCLPTRWYRDRLRPHAYMAQLSLDRGR